MTLTASLAFGAAAALGTVQVRTLLADRRASRRMREMAGLLEPREPTAPFRLRRPRPLQARRERRRALLLSSQLAPALELIVGHLRIGRNVGSALAEVSDSLAEPLRSIFVDAVEESRLGTPLGDALEQAARRQGSRHLAVVASAIGLQARHGGSLVEILEAVHTTIEEEDRLQRDIRTLTADNRLSARVLLALPPIVLVVVSILNPGYAAPLLTDPFGRQMSAAGVVLALVGWRWLRRLATPEVAV
jgi:tight adherence protein B